jgi:hypothetical protein
MLQLSELNPNEGGGMTHRLVATVSAMLALLLAGQEPDEGEPFARLLATAERDATSLESALREFSSSHRPTALEKTKASFARVSHDCTTCHASVRDTRK